VRRNYSLCTAPEDDQLKVTVKRIAGGLFSNWANDNLKPGDRIDVMEPHGSFTWDFEPGAANIMPPSPAAPESPRSCRC
jgi:ring-1,2-phenylacetyl-CoA epoxidase subunit PaaE